MRCKCLNRKEKQIQRNSMFVTQFMLAKKKNAHMIFTVNAPKKFNTPQKVK